jgi:large conductance mechanosensitive channel
MTRVISVRAPRVWDEFYEFISRGNIFDLAVGIIIGGAFGALTNSLVQDIIMPPIGLLLARVNFSDLYINLTAKHYRSLAEAEQAGAATINYGRFINITINFLMMAVVIFFLMRWMNRLRLEKPAPALAPMAKACPYCYTSIPIRATRCPNCTSPLEREDADDAG